MVNLIIVIISIGLTAATLFASLNYTPPWVAQSTENYGVVKAGFVALARAYQTTLAGYAAPNTGVAPAPTTATDGGMSQYFSAAYTYTPKAPNGFSWKYGNNGTDYYFCLYPNAASVGAGEGLYRALNRLTKVFPATQYYLVSGGVSACSSAKPATAYSTTTYPALVSAVFLVRYAP